MRLSFGSSHFTDYHTAVAEVISDTVSKIKNPYIITPISASMVCLGVRISSVFAAVAWSFSIVIDTIPYFICMTINQITDYEGSFGGILGQIVKVHVIFFSLLVIETAYFVGDILFPELMYGFFDLNQKRLMLYLNFLIQRIPSFPGIFRKAENRDALFKEVVFFAHAIGIQDDEWRKRLYDTLVVKLRSEDFSSSMRDRSSIDLKKEYMQVIIALTIETIQSALQSGCIEEVVQPLSSNVVKVLHKHLPVEILRVLCEARPDIEADLEQSKWRQSNGFYYRSTVTRKFLEILFDYMKCAKNELVARNCKEEFGFSMIEKIFCVALVKMLEDAKVLENGSVKMTSFIEPYDVTLSHPNQIYKNKEALLELHLALQSLSSEEKEEVLSRVSNQRVIPSSENIESVVQKIMHVKSVTFEGPFTDTEGYNPDEIIKLCELG